MNQMGSNTKSYYSLLFVVMAFLPALDAYYSRPPALEASYNSRATYYGSPDCYGTQTGACGYRKFGSTVNDGRVTGVSNLYRNGTGCGSCYQVKCKMPQLCSDDGAQVVVTDYGEGDRTDFILSSRAYASLARSESVKELFSYGVVDVEFKRTPCRYLGSNGFKLKVHEHSRYPEYLAVVMLYVSGQNDITAVDVWQADNQQWRGMRRAYGAVFDTPNPPSGSLTFRVQVSGSAGLKWVPLNNIITSKWKAGLVYDTRVQLS